MDSNSSTESSPVRSDISPEYQEAISNYMKNNKKYEIKSTIKPQGVMKSKATNHGKNKIERMLESRMSNSSTDSSIPDFVEPFEIKPKKIFCTKTFKFIDAPEEKKSPRVKKQQKQKRFVADTSKTYHVMMEMATGQLIKEQQQWRYPQATVYKPKAKDEWDNKTKYWHGTLDGCKMRYQILGLINTSEAMVNQHVALMERDTVIRKSKWKK